MDFRGVRKVFGRHCQARQELGAYGSFGGAGRPGLL